MNQPNALDLNQHDGGEDIISELQTCLDQLATQFYASLRYVSTHHPLSPPSTLANAVVNPGSLPNSYNAAGTATTPGSPNAQPATDIPPASPSHKPIDKTAFEEDIKELAQDLVAKQKDIHNLIERLPSDLQSEDVRQEQRIAELESELRSVEKNVRKVAKQREEVLERVDNVISHFKRV